MMRLVDPSRTTAILLCLLGCHVWKAVSKTQQDSDLKEVTLKVHLSDASTHQPLAGATVALFANHTPIITEVSAADGNTYLRFPYRLGTLLVVTATRQGYVPNSAPWRPARLPVFSSLSLELLPERAATLMVYEDLVEINSGPRGTRGQSWVQFQHRALSLPPNTSYSNLTALLTVTNDPGLIQHFPYLQGLGGNGTGSEIRFELTPVAAISVHLLASEGVGLQVSGPISISIALPANSGLKENQHIPAWRFDPHLGTWLKSSLGYVNLELVSTATEPDMTTPMLKPSYKHHDLVSNGNHSRMSLGNHSQSRHGSSLCNLTPRSRECRQSVETFPLKSALSPGTDTGYRQSYTSVSSSTNHLPDGHSSNRVQELAGELSGEGEGGTSVLEATSPCSPPVTPGRGEGSERRPTDYLLSRSVDHLERPQGSLPLSLPRPGQLLCCGSVDLLSGGDGYPRRIRPTLVIPAHYMRLPGEHPLCGQALLLQTDQQSDLETIQAELNASHSQQLLGQTHVAASANPGQGDGQEDWSSLSESLSIPTALGEAGLMQMNGEDTLLAERKLMELRGGKPLTHPRAWFVSLDGQSNAIRHSYIDLQRAGQTKGNTGGAGSRGNRHAKGNDTSLDSGVDLNELRVARRGREVERKVGERDREKDRERVRTKSGPPAMAYTQLVYVDDLDGADSEYQETPEGSPQDSPLGPLGQETRGHPDKQQGGGGGADGGGAEEEHRGESIIQKEAPSPLSSPPPLPEGGVFRTEIGPNALLAVASDDDGEEKKSPWQKREERPLLAAFNLK
ncbi:hypothetical protein DPEC_G00141690 [Dallia pectoralis]|uniref:Uncharacterized protein n=1 Tax=Dallia pectoralis TaxID=75939 RepID=A0ACC2GMS6_DALPE|nr:hypothetical protein DPEC_G00141690 [Dallia pectoralis]